VMFVGFDNDNSRTTASQPIQDTPGVFNDQVFGSAHSSGLNMLYCDSSVHYISYDVNVAQWSAMGSIISTKEGYLDQ
jgi:prepilin-type processing-associated H-X9-DG protein